MRLLIRYAAFAVFALGLMTLISMAKCDTQTGFYFIVVMGSAVGIYAGTSYVEGERKGNVAGFANALNEFSVDGKVYKLSDRLVNSQPPNEAPALPKPRT